MLKVIKKKEILIIFAIVVVAMIVGSLFDYQISQQLYDGENLFGLILAAYGQAPSALAMSASGVILLKTMNRRSVVSMVLSSVFGLLLVAFGLFMGYFEPADYLPQIPQVIHIVIALGLAIGFTGLILHLLKECSDAELRKFAYFMIFFVFAQIIVINVIKVPWGRPRMRFITEYPEVAFQNWWVIGSEVREYYLSLGVGSNEFKSFPSGHTASSLNILVITVLPLLNNKLLSKSKMLLAISLIFGVLVALSRVILGAHFVTDVTMGFLVSFLIYLLSLHLFYRKKI